MGKASIMTLCPSQFSERCPCSPAYLLLFRIIIPIAPRIVTASIAPPIQNTIGLIPTDESSVCELLSVVPSGVSVTVGTGVDVCADVGVEVGADVGIGVAVGFGVGETVGVEVGFGVGETVGVEVGFGVGETVGGEVGVGIGVAVGIGVGVDVGKGIGVTSGAAIVVTSSFDDVADALEVAVSFIL